MWELPGLGNGAAGLAFPTGVFTRDQSEVGHEGSRVREAAEVMQLGHDEGRRERVDAPKTAQPGHRLAMGFLFCCRRHLEIELVQALGGADPRPSDNSRRQPGWRNPRTPRIGSRPCGGSPSGVWSPGRSRDDGAGTGMAAPAAT